MDLVFLDGVIIDRTKARRSQAAMNEAEMKMSLAESMVIMSFNIAVLAAAMTIAMQCTRSVGTFRGVLNVVTAVVFPVYYIVMNAIGMLFPTFAFLKC